ncbi:hypothetical protein M0813_07030 [Anaeramoeba flamelloides]|uniref:Uncharacterized protein n=1 Tax=Anaeramoeba flamelloides TaxID=1746091 RepID=A0ABQ8XCW7_9EUKA|nr:hypothetical protein M0813_07030 [Anaeramoeba flamelloides]
MFGLLSAPYLTPSFNRNAQTFISIPSDLILNDNEFQNPSNFLGSAFSLVEIKKKLSGIKKYMTKPTILGAFNAVFASPLVSFLGFWMSHQKRENYHKLDSDAWQLKPLPFLSKVAIIGGIRALVEFSFIKKLTATENAIRNIQSKIYFTPNLILTAKMLTPFNNRTNDSILYPFVGIFSVFTEFLTLLNCLVSIQEPDKLRIANYSITKEQEENLI